jgi:hypothetical protein
LDFVEEIVRHSTHKIVAVILTAVMLGEGKFLFFEQRAEQTVRRNEIYFGL